LRACLAEGDAIFAKRHLVTADEGGYSHVNGRLHELVVQAAGQPLLTDMLDRANRIPFAAPAAIAFDRFNLEQMYDALWYAHRQHHAIVQAIEAGEGARAEALFREHVQIQKHSMNLVRGNACQNARDWPNGGRDAI
jgi:GntR family transcriptional regulator of vanillate catabolism